MRKKDLCHKKQHFLRGFSFGLRRGGEETAVLREDHVGCIGGDTTCVQKGMGDFSGHDGGSMKTRKGFWSTLAAGGKALMFTLAHIRLLASLDFCVACGPEPHLSWRQRRNRQRQRANRIHSMNLSGSMARIKRSSIRQRLHEFKRFYKRSMKVKT